jgi:hypothetical protein
LDAGIAVHDSISYSGDGACNMGAAGF